MPWAIDHVIKCDLLREKERTSLYVCVCNKWNARRFGQYRYKEYSELSRGRDGSDESDFQSRDKNTVTGLGGIREFDLDNEWNTALPWIEYVRFEMESSFKKDGGGIGGASQVKQTKSDFLFFPQIYWSINWPIRNRDLPTHRRRPFLWIEQASLLRIQYGPWVALSFLSLRFSCSSQFPHRRRQNHHGLYVCHSMLLY